MNLREAAQAFQRAGEAVARRRTAREHALGQERRAKTELLTTLYDSIATAIPELSDKVVDGQHAVTVQSRGTRTWALARTEQGGWRLALVHSGEVEWVTLESQLRELDVGQNAEALAERLEQALTGRSGKTTERARRHSQELRAIATLLERKNG